MNPPERDLAFLLNPAVTMDTRQIPVLQPQHLELKLHQLFAIGMTLRQNTNPQRALLFFALGTV